MSEVKPVYQQRVRFNFWEDITQAQYEKSTFGDGVPRILYPSLVVEELRSALEAEQLMTDVLRRQFMSKSHEFDLLQAENAEQAKRIAVYEQFMRTCDKQAAEYELSEQKGTE